MGPQQLIMLAVLGLTFWYFFVKPQADEAKRHKTLIQNLEKGDVVATVGGLIGTVVSVHDKFVTIRIADRVEVRVKTEGIQEEITDI